jgi:shikimate kinase
MCGNGREPTGLTIRAWRHYARVDLWPVCGSLAVEDDAFNARRGETKGRTMSGTVSLTPPRSIVLVGLMGAGKSNIGRRLASRLQLPFTDADAEIEAAAGESIEEIFARYGEPYFRAGERRVLARLLDGPVHVLATGGGAFMDAQTRERVRARGISIWLRADLELLLARVARRDNRPLLKDGDRRAILATLIEQRHPVYAEADIIVDSIDGPPELTLSRVLAALKDFLAAEAGRTEGAARRGAGG